MGGEWKRVRFSDAVWVNPPVPLKRGVDYPFVEMQDLNPSKRAARSKQNRTFTGGGSRFAAGDTLMARITPCLENEKTARFISEDDEAIAHGSTEFIVIRGRPSVSDTNFAYYLTRWREVQDFAISQMTGTSGRQRVPTEALSHLTVPLPPLPVQHRIADILGSLDDKIELNRRTNETLEAMARALFKSWFVDFDPVVAKSEGRQPEGMDAETAKLFPSSFEESEIGRVPKGWKVKTVSENADINTWTLGKNDDLNLIQYVEISEVNRGDIGNIQIFERGKEPSRARRRLRHGDTVLSTVRPDRRSYFLCLNPPQELIASTGFAVLSPMKVPWSFLHAGLTQPDVFDHLGQHADGGAYPAVRSELIGAWSLACPQDAQIFDSFHKVCAPLFEQTECNRCACRTLADLRDALLPELISGALSSFFYRHA